MQCVDAPNFVISIWIQVWIWIQCMDLHGHFILHNINMNTDMEMDYDAMACFCLLHDGYDTEVIFVYGTEPVLLYFFFYCALLIIVLCGLYFDSHILVVLFIYLILINYIHCINCV